MRHVSDDERRARIGVRHALEPMFHVDSPEAATRAMTVLHATESATVYLSCWARVRSVDAADVDRALYDQRSLVKQLAMRRTLFTFPRDLLPAAWSSASARVANTERARMAKDVVKAGLAVDGNDWLDRARTEVLKLLTDRPEGLSAVEIRQAVPMIDVKVEGSAGEIWSAPRVLTHLGATADIMRGTNTARFPVSRPLWTLTRHWLDDAPRRSRICRRLSRNSPPLALHLRAGHGRRHRLVAGLDEDGRPGRPRRTRRRCSLTRRRRHRLVATG